ncbi:MAG: TatD family hydrolase [Verrucomicrobia bacterium]|nr:TatD family hydrolase [Verrucomicrobiota bacterium]
MLVDTHAHLASKQFSDDLPQIMAQARAAGMKRIICVSTNLEDAPAVLKIAETYDEVFATVGVHPCDADSVTDGSFIDVLRELAAHPKVVGMGEIGLDYFHQPPDGFTLETWKAHQAFVLRTQLELAAELGLNVVLHNRESFADLSAQVLPFHGRLRAVLHCFTGTYEDAKPLVEQGHLVSFTGIVTFKNGQIIQECARAVPDGSFMLETDCPYLAPMPHRGQRNEPAYVAHTAAFVAGLRGVTMEHITRVTGATVDGFFRRPGSA